MQAWFIRQNNQSVGPYSVDDLKRLGFTSEDYVWKEGYDNWVEVKAVDELNELFSKNTPPPFQPSTMTYASDIPGSKPYTDNYYNAPKPKKGSSFIKWVFGILGTLAVGLFVTFLVFREIDPPYYIDSYVEKSPEQLRQELAASEKANPGQYLDANAKMRTNLIGEKVIEGTISNNASVAVFKDMILEIEFLSKTDAVISTQRFAVYEVVSPKQFSKFKHKTFGPNGTEGFRISVVNATPMN